MEDKTFALLEKMYVELVDFKKETSRSFQRIENKFDGEVTPKIKTLFDGYKANSEILEDLNDKVDSLQVDVNNLSIKITSNDNRILEIKRNLKSVK